jgi:hypothetical protein
MAIRRNRREKQLRRIKRQGTLTAGRLKTSVIETVNLFNAINEAVKRHAALLNAIVEEVGKDKIEARLKPSETLSETPSDVPAHASAT